MCDVIVAGYVCCVFINDVINCGDDWTYLGFLLHLGVCRSVRGVLSTAKERSGAISRTWIWVSFC